MYEPSPILIISDTHYHNFTQYASVTPSGVNTRLADIIRATIEAANALKTAGGKHIFHCGDMFHVRGNIPPTVLNPVMGMFKFLISQGFEITVISGNHDLETNDAADVSSTVTALRSIGVTVINKSTAIWISGHRYTFIPWMPKLADLRAEIAKPRVEPGMGKPASDNLIIHAPLNGVIEGLPDHGLTPKDFDGLGFKFVFCGHYHNYKVMRTPDNETFVVSVGALTHQNWGDVNSQAGYILFTPRGAVPLMQRETSAPKFIKVDILDLDKAPVADNYVKVVGGSFTDNADIQAIRDDLTLRGAKGVVVEGMIARPTATRSAVTRTAPTIHDVLADYIDRTYPGDADVKVEALDILKDIYD
jgi:DNA repair exonuclease SbcCD nuclease subunit